MKIKKHRIHIQRKAGMVIFAAVVVAVIILVVGIVNGNKNDVRINGNYDTL